MKVRNVTDNKLVILLSIICLVVILYFAIDTSNTINKYNYTFDSYEYSYDNKKWMRISRNQLAKESFNAEHTLFIKAKMKPDKAGRVESGLQTVVIETNDVGVAVTCSNKLLFNELFKGSYHENEFTYGNSAEFRVVSVENSQDLYDEGIIFEFMPNENNQYIKVYNLSIYGDDSYRDILEHVSFMKILVAILLIALGAVLLLTLSPALKHTNSLEFRYYVIGAVSISAGVFVMFITNYYFTEQGNEYNFFMKLSFILMYSMTIPYAVELYDVLRILYPKDKARFRKIIIVAVIISILLITNIFTQIISNRSANAIFIATNVILVLMSIMETIYNVFTRTIKKQKFKKGRVLVQTVSLTCHTILIWGMSAVLLNRFSISLNLFAFKTFIVFDIYVILIYMLDTRMLIVQSGYIKQRTEKSSILTRLMLDMNSELVEVDKTNVGHALNEIVEIANKYLPELIYWESLLINIDLDKKLVMDNKEKFKLESALEYILVCSEVILNGEESAVNKANNFVIVGASPQHRNKIGTVLEDELLEDYKKIYNGEQLSEDIFAVGSEVPQFKGVYIIGKGLNKFRDVHKDMVNKNIKVIYESVENTLIQNEMKRNQRQIIYDLTTISESKSKETYNHVNRVVNYTRVLAQGLGFSEEEIETISIASAMHDLGKISIPYEILHKNGKLTDEEFDVIKTHTKIGYEILKVNQGELFRAAAIIARDHHEKYNGRGYNGMKGEEIHIYARIVALADVFDALAAERAYKKAWPLDRVMNLIISESGEHFDPKVVDVFLDRFNEFLDIKRKYAD